MNHPYLEANPECFWADIMFSPFSASLNATTVAIGATTTPTEPNHNNIYFILFSFIGFNCVDKLVYIR